MKEKDFPIRFSSVLPEPHFNSEEEIKILPDKQKQIIWY
jgi:hypothetical protein